ncbi:MAG: class I adenylate-forming enzyme family protein [Acidimicrobiia bacterium]
MLVHDIVRRNAHFFGDADAAVVPGGATRSWAEMEARTNQLARGLRSLGLDEGDRIAAFSANTIEYLELFFGCAKSGVVGASTSTRLSPHELVAYLRYVQPSAILVDAEHRAEAEWIAQIPSIRHVLVTGGGALDGDVDLDELVGTQDATAPDYGITPDHAYQLSPTGGTTGIPKGAVLTHRNAYASYANWAMEMPLPERGTYLQTVPFSSNPGGVSGLHPVILKGGRSVIVPAFEPGLFLRMVQEHRVTHVIIVPTMLTTVLSHPALAETDVSSVIWIGCGASPVPRDLLQRARQVFGDVFVPMFGMAETYSSGLSLRRENQHLDGTEAEVRRLTSAGKPHVFMMARVVDEDGHDVPRDGTTSGELWLRGDSVTEGYFEMPEETAEAFVDGWLRTGDIATMDDEGFITIVDRRKDIIITGGLNVFSREVEEAVYDHPAVLHAAAIGIPSERWGESIHVVVVLREGRTATEDEILSFAAERLAAFKKPRSLEIRPSVPISGAGKILKRELRAEFWNDEERTI